VQECIQRKRLAKKKWDTETTEESRHEYRKMQHRVKVEVAKAKQREYNDLYARLVSEEGETNLYRSVWQRDRDGKDVQQVRVVKKRKEKVLTGTRGVIRRWRKEYFKELMIEENKRERRVEEVTVVDQEVAKISKGKAMRAFKSIKSGKAVGPDDILVEVWKCLKEVTVVFD